MSHAILSKLYCISLKIMKILIWDNIKPYLCSKAKSNQCKIVINMDINITQIELEINL